MKIVVLSPKSKTVYNFRGELIRDMVKKGSEVTVVAPDDIYSEEIKSLGVTEIITLPFVKDNTSVIGDIRYFLGLKKILKKLRPDIVFSYTIKPVIYGSVAARSSGVSKIYPMITGLGRVYTGSGLKRKLLRTLTDRLYKTALGKADKVIFQNEDDLKMFVDGKIVRPEKAIKVGGSGVDMKRFVKCPVPNETVFLMVGRIIAEKGVMEYCKAAEIVKRSHPEARFILLGGFDSSIGALKAEDIEPFIRNKTVEYPGEVKDPVGYYSECSVFVLPTYYYEGLPRTILEAMATGRAVITTDWRGCREAVKDGENGFLVEPQNVTQLAQKMTLLAENKKLSLQMGENSYRKCLEEYSTDKINQAMREIIGY